MVDVDTALKASAYSGRKRSKEDGSKERVSKTLEPFDPAAAFEKEKADAWSMWLVISLAAAFALFQRYVILPSMDGRMTYLWNSANAAARDITSHIDHASAFSFSNAAAGSKGSRVFETRSFEPSSFDRFLPE